MGSCITDTWEIWNGSSSRDEIEAFLLGKEASKWAPWQICKQQLHPHSSSFVQLKEWTPTSKQAVTPQVPMR